ncbi:MAG: AGE family epimerase/isomerase [Aggregatilineales bacterium]
MPILEQDIRMYQNQIQHHFLNALVPFWSERALDENSGGFLTNFDADGVTLPTPEKYLNTQARLIWWFSSLYEKFPEQTEFAEYASQGVTFLINHLWDPESGGWFWKVSKEGTPIVDAKIVYGQSFAIYALSQYFLATQDARGLDYAIQTYDLLQKHCLDQTYGGYHENLKHDWSLADNGFAGGDRKTLDTHMHLMEAFTVLYQASHEKRHYASLIELINLIVEKMVDPATGCGRNQFLTSFEPIPAIAIQHTWNAERAGDVPAVPTDTTSFGHNVELAWLMRRALQVAEVDQHPYYPIMEKLYKHALQYGIDEAYGGIYRDGTSSGEVLVDEKEFWQNAESLVGFLDAYEVFNDKLFWDAFVNIWTFVDNFMINHIIGEWYTLLNREGEPLDRNLGNPWKVAYHTGRSMLECVQRLDYLAEQASKEKQ